MAAGRRGILLVPEIALAPALVRRLVARFGERVSLLHSGLSDGERAAEWERARRGDVDAVVGPRSAVFAPLPDLGLLVIDEAHDASYKQAESPRYDARDVARVRAKEERATVVFGSATPSMELERAAREGRLPRLVLPERPGARPRAAVEVVDLRDETAREGDHGRVLFAARTVEILAACFSRGEQAIVLLNRRGFSPSLLCRACGEDFRCRNCSVARTYHRRNERLLCHYCGDDIRRPPTCPSCGSDALQPIGFGTERLAERFAETFPGVPFAVLDRDAAARRGGAAGVLMDFESGTSQALLGTQMVAKGHDFPNATALAVLDADALLSFPDFRAAERTFQLVTQAAGRVGRGDRPGIVAVQTSRPDHEAIRAAVRQDHVAFADAELRFRKAFRYPPYTRLLLALFSDADLAKAHRAAGQAFAALASAPVASRVKLLGPAPAPLERLKGVWRYHLVVKAETREAIAEAARAPRGAARPAEAGRRPAEPVVDIRRLRNTTGETMVSYPRACLKILRESGAGPLRRAQWLSMYAFARFPRPRPSEGTSRADEPRGESAVDNPLEPFDEAVMLRDLTRQGFAHGLHLTAANLAAVRLLARERETRGTLHPLAPQYETSGDPTVACYEDTALWPPVEAIALNLRPLARRALGRGCTFLGSRVWWSFPHEGSASDEIQTGRRFHFDLYAWRSLAGFFYLTDVDENAGPHVCVLGTHRRKALRHQFSSSRWREDADIESVYGRGSLRTLLGPAGTGFLEDPTCFHKAVAPARAARLLLQLLWGSEDFVAPGFSRQLSQESSCKVTGSGRGSEGSRRAT